MLQLETQNTLKKLVSVGLKANLHTSFFIEV